MICDKCHGTGRIVFRQRVAYQRRTYEWQEVCQDCGGTGRQHCCEGLREQPESEGGRDDA